MFELYLQPKEKKLSQQKTNIPPNADQKLGKVIFVMQFIPTDDFAKEKQLEQMNNDREEEEVRYNKEQDDLRR